MSRILIWDIPLLLKANSGGPAGYLYNIKSYMDNHPEIDNIIFASQLENRENIPNLYQSQPSKLRIIYRKIKSKKNQSIIRRFFKVLEFLNNIRTFYHKDKLLPIGLETLNEFDVIHFHSAIHLVNVRHLLKDYKGKLVLTTHCPEPYSIEMLTSFFKNSFYINLFKPIFLIKEIEGWRACDYFIFAVPQAIEVYFKSKWMHRHYLNNKKKFMFCPSSINQDYDLVGIDIRTKQNIPNGSFIISFVGRHNEIKGYDQLKIFAEKVLEKHQNVYFIIAGAETPLTRLEHPRWREIGLIDYVSDLLEQSDMFVLPNRETYFDLVTLEVLRMGTPLLLSDTGGNRYFKTFPPSEIRGLYFYEYGNIQSQLDAFEKIYNFTPYMHSENLRQNNMALFKKYFTTEKFIERYIKVMEDIIRKDKASSIE